MQYIQVYNMPFWYITVYAGTSRYKIFIPGYTGIYLNVRNRLVLSWWWGFQMAAGPPLQRRRALLTVTLAGWPGPRLLTGGPGWPGRARDILVQLQVEVRAELFGPAQSHSRLRLGQPE